MSTIPYYVYMLRCSDNTLYTGITTDIARRLHEHKHKIGSSYTASRGATAIVFSEMHPGRSDALKREAAIKKMTRAQKEQLIAPAHGTL